MAGAEHRIIMQDGTVVTGRIQGVADNTIQVQLPAGTIGYPLARVSSVEMPTPPHVARAQAAFQQGNFEEAYQLSHGINRHFMGLPTSWARQSAMMEGDVLVELERYDEAASQYQKAQQFYPEAGGAQTRVGMARIAVAQGNYAEARETLDQFSELALNQKNATTAQEIVFGQVFYLLGQIDEAQGNYPGALENYLRTVAIFPGSATATEAALERANQLRNEHNLIVP